MFAEQAEYLDKTIEGNRPKILLVEDDHDISLMLREHLEYSLRADVRLAESGVEALEVDRADPSELAIVDFMLPDMNGLNLMADLNRVHHRPIVFITGYGTLDRVIEALRCGAADLFLKPLDLQALSAALADLIEQSRRQQTRIRRLERLRKHAKSVIRERRKVRRRLDLVCRDLVSAYQDLATQVAALARRQSQA